VICCEAEAGIAVGNSGFRNLLVANSISKRSCAPGLRSGFIAGDKNILKRYLRYRTYVGCASPLPLQKAAAAAWRDQRHTGDFRNRYRRNFELAKEYLGTDIPKATFYIWLKTDDDILFAKELYLRYNLKVLPGSFLSRTEAGKGYVRLALVYEEEQMREAFERLKQFRSETGY
jgi:aspartate/methionine/tyrosine aminotransferase